MGSSLGPTSHDLGTLSGHFGSRNRLAFILGSIGDQVHTSFGSLVLSVWCLALELFSSPKIPSEVSPSTTEDEQFLSGSANDWNNCGRVILDLFSNSKRVRSEKWGWGKIGLAGRCNFQFVWYVSNQRLDHRYNSFGVRLSGLLDAQRHFFHTPSLQSLPDW